MYVYKLSFLNYNQTPLRPSILSIHTRLHPNSMNGSNLVWRVQHGRHCFKNSSRWSRSHLGCCTSCKSWSCHDGQWMYLWIMFEIVYESTLELEVGHDQITKMNLLLKTWRRSCDVIILTLNLIIISIVGRRQIQSHRTYVSCLRVRLGLHMVQTDSQHILQSWTNKST